MHAYIDTELLLLIHAVEGLLLSIENTDYMVKENVVSFVAAVSASQATDFEYTVTVETLDDTAVGKQGRIAFSAKLYRYTKLLPIIMCAYYICSKIVILIFVTEEIFAQVYSYPDQFPVSNIRHLTLNFVKSDRKLCNSPFGTKRLCR